MKAPRGYYAILDLPAGSCGNLLEAEERARRLLRGGPCCLQIRAKTATASQLLALGEAIIPACRAARVPLCVNDRLDVALALGADAVHLGQDDLPLAEARAIAGGRLAIGVSTHNRAQAAVAVAEGADYLALGPIFPTRTKQNPDAVVGLSGLAEVRGLTTLPIVAIGGIRISRASEVAAAGASAGALVAAMDVAIDVAQAGRIVNEAFGLS